MGEVDTAGKGLTGGGGVMLTIFIPRQSDFSTSHLDFVSSHPWISGIYLTGQERPTADRSRHRGTIHILHHVRRGGSA
jgi:hypothetical protein